MRLVPIQISAHLWPVAVTVVIVLVTGIPIAFWVPSSSLRSSSLSGVCDAHLTQLLRYQRVGAVRPTVYDPPPSCCERLACCARDSLLRTTRFLERLTPHPFHPVHCSPAAPVAALAPVAAAVTYAVPPDLRHAGVVRLHGDRRSVSGVGFPVTARAVGSRSPIKAVRRA
jgi:hypothetical protein